MQTASASLLNKLKQSNDINSSLEVIAEWNQNRFGIIKSISNNRLIGTATITDATNLVTTSAVHGLEIHDRIQFGAVTGTTNLFAGVTYFVLTVPSTTTMTLAATFSGAVINITIDGSTTAFYEVMEDYDEELFPIESIALPDRPTRGILKARASSKAMIAGVGAESWTNTGYQDVPSGARYGTADVNSKYKYWTSPAESTGSYANTPASIANCSPSVVYTTTRLANKIVIGFESSYAQPSIYTVQITTDGTTWTTVATTPTIPSNGRVELYRQSGGTWTTTVDRNYPLAIQGVKIDVTQMSQSKVFFNLIELSPRLETDLSAFVIDCDISNAMSEASFITPLGTASANTGSVNLSNFDGQFTNDEATSPYLGMLDKNVELRVSEGTNIGSYAVPDFEWIRLATMKSTAWSGQTRDTTSVELSDDAVRLQELKPNAVFFQSMTIGEIIWRLLDSVGFNNYQYESRDDDPATTVPFFWTDGTKTIWEIINELTQATQTAVYFDEHNILQIMTRSAALDLAKVDAPTWTFNSVPDGTTLPDIVEATKTHDYEANTVNTSYVTTKLSDVSPSGVPIMETAWEPEGDLVLRSATLVSAMTTTSTTGWFDPRYMSSWPFTGIIQLEGEFMRYTHKGYCYYNAAGTLTYTYIKSQDEKVALDKKNTSLAFKNFYNGRLYFSLANRGLWSSVPKAHVVDISAYAGRYRTLGGAMGVWKGGMIHDKNRGVMRLATNKTFTANSWYTALRGSSLDAQPRHYGTRIWFPQSGYSGTGGSAGMVIGAGTNDSGFYVELSRTVAVGNRAWTNELCFYVKHTDGHIVRVAGKGLSLPVGVNSWFDMDVTVTYPGAGAITFSISLNGVLKWNVTVSNAQRPDALLSGRFGVFTRGWTIADFEYLYASTSYQADAPDEEGYFDRISGGYQSSQLMREWMYSSRRMSRIVRKKRVYYYQKYNQTLIDEFGPVGHEVREFDIQFSKNPVLNSNLYFSNETQVICPEYVADSFGAKFILANTARVNAIVKGEDSITFGAERPVTQKALIYGRTVTSADAKIHTVKDDAGIRRRGEVAVDINSPWIQSEAAAKTIGDWIVLHWSTGCDEVEMKIFGNPLIQLADVIAVNYPLLSMLAATHKYYVIKVDQSYSAGLSTTLTLRRVGSARPVANPVA